MDNVAWIAPALRSWTIGLIAGAVALLATEFVFPVGIAAVMLVSLLRPRPAAAAGACVAWGGAFLTFMWTAAERCDAFNRQPNARCTMGDNTFFLGTGLALLVFGLLLTAYAARRARRIALTSA